MKLEQELEIKNGIISSYQDKVRHFHPIEILLRIIYKWTAFSAIH